MQPTVSTHLVGPPTMLVREPVQQRRLRPASACPTPTRASRRCRASSHASSGRRAAPGTGIADSRADSRACRNARLARHRKGPRGREAQPSSGGARGWSGLSWIAASCHEQRSRTPAPSARAARRASQDPSSSRSGRAGASSVPRGDVEPGDRCCQLVDRRSARGSETA
jgi:hypothetical protein